MKILTAEQIRSLDTYTIEHEPLSSVDLMERAADQCTGWIIDHFSAPQRFDVVCGKGNNGGDGLVVARFLHTAGYDVHVYICPIGSASPDFAHNLGRLQEECGIQPDDVDFDDPPAIPADAILIDAIFGSGLNRPLEGKLAGFADYLCTLPNLVIAIDIPSGVFADKATQSPAVCADFTLSFEFPKRAFFIPENHRFVGEWVILPIGLDAEHARQMETPWQTLDSQIIRKGLLQRTKYGHKGTYGHALLVTGSYGMGGAAVLAANAALRSGVGLLSLHVPRSLYEIAQISAPEALCLTDSHERIFSGVEAPEKYDAIGIGCGLGTDEITLKGLQQLLRVSKRPVVMDADALNLTGMHRALLEDIPPHSILTPHPREFARIFGESNTHFNRLDMLSQACAEYNLIIVLKGAHTAIGLPDKRIFFNTTGNPGMATGGSGDVLTGIITGLLAQGYTPAEAAKTGVYIHGLAGDIAAGKKGQEALIARDIIENISNAYQTLVSL